MPQHQQSEEVTAAEEVDIGGDEAPELSARATTARPQREGLPPTYRMRAEPHYVEQLGGTTGPRAPERGRAPVLNLDRLHAQLAEDLATLQGALTLVGGNATLVARQVSLDLMRHQAWRAAWLLDAAALLQGKHRLTSRSRRLGRVLDAVRESLEADCRVTRVGLDMHASDWNAVVDVDEHLIRTAIAGAVLATTPLMGAPEWGSVRVSAVDTEGVLSRIDVTQEESGCDENVRRSFFDPTVAERPGGWVAGVGAAAAQAAALLLGGEAALEATGRRGTRLRLTFGRIG